MSDLQEDIKQKEIVIEKLESELQELRSRPFREEDFERGVSLSKPEFGSVQTSKSSLTPSTTSSTIPLRSPVDRLSS